MRYLLTILLIIGYVNSVFSQEKHFVFIQSDNKQPFYASVNGKIYSSTSTGYVIIPKLAQGNYSVTIGFAQNTSPEQNFTLSVDQKDLGYNLKNFGEKGYGLFNLQTLDVTMASSGASSGTAIAARIKENPDDNIISFPARKKDTTVARVETKPFQKKVVTEPVVKSEEQSVSAGVKDSVAVAKGEVGLNTPTRDESQNKQQPLASVASTEVTPVTNNTAVAAKDNNAGLSRTENKPDAGSASQSIKASTNVTKVSEKKSDEGMFLSFVDNNGKKADTVQVIIPATKTSAASTALPASKDSNAPVVTAESTIKSKAKKDEPKFLDVDVTGSKKDVTNATSRQEEAVAIMPNSNCKSIASDDDYARLRKKMAQETTDEKMIAEAKKYYREKCFTTDQIKRLSTLFLSDEGRLNFFNASFLSVADSPKYPTLQSEFIDPAFVTRFKTLFQ